MAQSLYRQASLVMNPYGAKDTLLPSIKPTDGSGDFTFSRDGAGGDLAATRVNASGYIEKGRENLLLQSNQFDTTWANSNTTETGGQADKDGGTSAWLLDKSAANGFISQAITSAEVSTFSVYAKAGTTDWVYLNLINTTTYFDLTNGIVGNVSGGDRIDSKIESVGGGWYRISIASNSIDGVRIYPAEGNGDTSGTSGSIYIQDAQLEQGLVATDYIETTTAPVSAGLLGDMPRLDYHNPDSPTPNSCPSLLLEPSRTNAVTQSEYFDGGSLTNTTISAEYNTADTLSPEGVYNAAKLTATGSFPRYYNFPSTSDNTDIVISSFAKAGDASVYSLFASDKNLDAAQVYFDLSAGTATLAGTSVLTPAGYDIEPMGNGWYRCWLSINTGTGASSVQIRPIAHAQGQSGGWSGSNYIYAYGAQYETASYPTSYIPTYGSAAQRGVDIAYVTSATDLIGQTEGTLFFEGKINGQESYNRRLLAISDGGTANKIEVFNPSNSLKLRAVTSDANVLQFDIESGSILTIGETFKVAIAYAENDFVLYVNGTQIGTDTSGSIPTTNKINFGRGDNAFNAESPVNQALLFKTRLTNAELTALTTI